VYVLRQNCRAAGWRWDSKINLISEVKQSRVWSLFGWVLNCFTNSSGELKQLNWNCTEKKGYRIVITLNVDVEKIKPFRTV
jgi:hypothetical protein